MWLLYHKEFEYLQVLVWQGPESNPAWVGQMTEQLTLSMIYLASLFSGHLPPYRPQTRSYLGSSLPSLLLYFMLTPRTWNLPTHSEHFRLICPVSTPSEHSRLICPLVQGGQTRPQGCWLSCYLLGVGRKLCGCGVPGDTAQIQCLSPPSPLSKLERSLLLRLAFPALLFWLQDAHHWRLLPMAVLQLIEQETEFSGGLEDSKAVSCSCHLWVSEQRLIF